MDWVVWDSFTNAQNHEIRVQAVFANMFVIVFFPALAGEAQTSKDMLARPTLASYSAAAMSESGGKG